MVKAIKKICYKAVQWHMLRIYAIIMSTIFVCIWLTAMVGVIQEILKTFFGIY